MEDKPNYYAIIPATVRYDKRLRDKAKLLYGEITALCNKEGYCWATNKYFSDLYEVSIKCISTLINQLKNLGYISVEMVYEDGSSKIKQRNIYVHESSILTKSSIGMEQKVNTPMEQKVKDNNIKDNNTINTTTKEGNGHSLGKPNIYIKPTKEEVLEFGRSIGAKYDLEHFFNYYDVTDWVDGSGNHFNWKQKMLTWNLSEEMKTKRLGKKKVTNIPNNKEEQEFKPL